MTEKRVMKLASRGKRFGAACIDAVVPVVSYLLMTTILAANGISYNYPGYGYGNGFGYGYGYGYGFDYGYGIGSQRLSGASAAVLTVVFLVLLAYIVVELVLFAKGKTIGKAVLGLQVVSSTDGKPFRFWKMFFRECFVKSASGSVFALGYIWILIDEKNRGWHDKILDSYVVDLKESERMQYMRQLKAARAAAPSPEPAPEPAVEPVPEPGSVEEPAAENEVAGLEPEVIELKPEAAEAEPEVIELEPEVAAVEPEFIEAEPLAAEEAVTGETAEISVVGPDEPVIEEPTAEEAAEDNDI